MLPSHHKHWHKLKHSAVVSARQVLGTYYQLLYIVYKLSIGPRWDNQAAFKCKISLCCRLLKHTLKDIKQLKALVDKMGTSFTEPLNGMILFA